MSLWLWAGLSKDEASCPRSGVHTASGRHADVALATVEYTASRMPEYKPPQLDQKWLRSIVTVGRAPGTGTKYGPTARAGDCQR